MKKADVQVGACYLANHTSGRIFVKINQEVTHRHFKGNKTIHWLATNGKTGRVIEIKSATKLIVEVPEKFFLGV